MNGIRIFFSTITVFTLLMACTREKSPEIINVDGLTIEQIQQGYHSGSFSIEDIVFSYLQRIDSIDKHGPELRSVLVTNPNALQIARQLDDELLAGKVRGPLHGIPVLLKDNIATKDKMPTTAGSRALMNSYVPYDSHLAVKLREAGAIILGKTNLSEWANFRGQNSSSGWSGVGGQTKNPYQLDHNPCGSSSGSAVAVSANLSPLAIGTETNGSIVCPSHANGIVGIKPTVGLWSRSGIIPISSTQDTPGPMAKTVREAALFLGVLAGQDPADPKTAISARHLYKDYTHFLNKDGITGKKIGWYQAPMNRHKGVDSLMQNAVKWMEENGAEIILIERIAPENVGYYSYQVMLYEYKDGLNQYFQSLGDSSPIKNLTELIEFNKNDSIELMYFDQYYLEKANEMGSLEDEEYQKALKLLMEGSREKGIDSVMNRHQLDAIIAPTGAPAWKTDYENGDHFTLGSSSPAAQSGYPNITVPMGFINELPVGISIFGKAWSEPTLIEIAYAYEQGTKHREAPRFLKKISNGNTNNR